MPVTYNRFITADHPVILASTYEKWLFFKALPTP